MQRNAKRFHTDPTHVKTEQIEAFGLVVILPGESQRPNVQVPAWASIFD